MPPGQLQTVDHTFRPLVEPLVEPLGSQKTDAELLHQYVAHGDTIAFATLARRHARLIRSVGRRVLVCHEDIEDILQATLLVLVRKADTIRSEQALASWLYGVAYRIASNAKKSNERRHRYERRAAIRKAEQPVVQASLHELQALLDEETQRLPEKYRAPFVLCCLEGLTKAEAARQLGWKEGTVSGRLAQARSQLRDNLMRRGVSLSSVLCAVALSQEAVSANVPTPLVSALLGSAVTTTSGVSDKVIALAEGGVVAMAPVKISLGLLAGLVIVVGALGAGLMAIQVPTATSTPPDKQISVAQKADEPRPANSKQAESGPTDLYGDPLPNGAAARLGTVRFRHGSTVTGLAFLSDGKTLLSGSYDKTIRLWDSATGRELRKLPSLNGSVMEFSVSQDGNTLAAVDTGSIYLADLSTWRLTEPKFSAGKSYTCVALSADGRTLAAGTRDNFHVYLWEVKTGKLLQEFQGHKARIECLAFSPEGDRLATGSTDATFRVWDLATGKEKIRQTGKGTHYSVAFSRDGKLLATGDEDGKLRLWQMPNGKLLHTLGSHHPCVEQIVFSPNGKHIASAGSGSAIHLWELATGKLIHRMWGYPEALAFSSDGKMLASGDHSCTIRLWDVATGKEQTTSSTGHTKKLRGVAVSADGSVVVTNTFGGGTRIIRLWESATGKEIRQFIDKSALTGSVALSPNGDIVASERTLWRRASGKILSKIEGQNFSIEAIAFSPDGQTLAMGTTNTRAAKDGTIRLWDVATAKNRGKFCDQFVQSLAFSPDGITLAIGSTTGSIGLWNINTGHRIRLFAQEHTRRVRAIAFSANGKTLASCTFAGDLFLWDVESGKVRQRLTPDNPRAMTNLFTLAFSSDGQMLASAGTSEPYGAKGNDIYLWEVATGKKRLELTGHQGNINTLAFASDGKMLISGSSDTTALVWDVTLPLGPKANKPSKRSHEELDALWSALLQRDAHKSYRAICLLARSTNGVTFLEQQLVTSATDSKQIIQWIKELDDERFEVREKATAELARLGLSAESALQKALTDDISEEANRRLKQLLKRISGELLRTRRAVEVLELTRSLMAKQLLRALARGPARNRLTQYAKACLSRLDERERKDGN